MKSVPQKHVPNDKRPLSFLQIGLYYLAIIVGLILRTNTISLPLDRLLYEAIYNLPHPTWLLQIVSVIDKNFLPIGHPHPSFLIVTYVVFLLIIFLKGREDFWWALLSIIIGLLLIGIVVFFDTTLVFRIRPYDLLPNHVSESVKEIFRSWTSYPSGHTRDTAVIAAIMTYYLPRGEYLFFFYALFVGLSRIFLGVHFPTDVLSGLVIGYAIGYVTLRLVQRIRLTRSVQRSK
jgi:undecaprenyl-diphosphatase